MLSDEENGSFNPNHQSDCELDEINGGKMDQFVSSPLCGKPRNFALAPAATVIPYWELARENALGDRYFQSIVGASAANNMYLEGYQPMLDAHKEGKCPPAPPDCVSALSIYPCVYDPADIPFQYYPKFSDNSTYMRDIAKLEQDLKMGTLPAVSFVKALGYKSEHPGSGASISDGVSFVTKVVGELLHSRYASSLLILVLHDEGGGYFDHVAPPKTSAVDGKRYGTRVPFLAIGNFARKNYVSHKILEHASVVKFIEWNWLDRQTGQLGTRDTAVNNLGSLLDPAATGEAVPEM